MYLYVYLKYVFVILKLYIRSILLTYTLLNLIIQVYLTVKGDCFIRL